MQASANGTKSDILAHQFALVKGGPFHVLLGRLGLLGPDDLPLPRAALSVALAAWLPPAVLAVAQSLIDERYHGFSFFTDFTSHTRYLAAIGVMIATERYASGRISLLIRQFLDAGLIPRDSTPAFTAALESADRRSASALAEGLLLIAALVWSGVTTSYAVALSGASWDGTVVEGVVSLSWAGQAARFVGTPLFVFLTLRWLWRFLVWTALLYRVSRLPLRLMPLHPDRSAGLGFLAIYPSVFTGFVFAQSAVVASSMVKELSLARHSSDTVWFAVAGWLAVNLFLFIGPLLVFVRPLYRARERAVLDYGRLANQHHLAFDRRWIGEKRSGEELLGSPDPSSVSDLNASVQAALTLRVVPIDIAAAAQLVVAAGIPMLAVVATQIPLVEVGRWIFGVIL